MLYTTEVDIDIDIRDLAHELTNKDIVDLLSGCENRDAIEIIGEWRKKQILRADEQERLSEEIKA